MNTFGGWQQLQSGAVIEGVDPPPKRIIAIDPGTEQSAVVEWDGTKIHSAVILRNDALLAWLRAGERTTDVCCIERMACYGKAVGKDVLETCEWVGRFAEAWESHAGTGAMLVYRHQIKMHHCHYMQAKDSNIRQALIDKYGRPGTKKAPGVTHGLKKDMWSAFAIATYASDAFIAS